VLKVATATLLGLLFGAAISLVGLGRVNVFSPQLASTVSLYAWWIVVLSMLLPLTDYLTSVRTTMMGFVTGHPFRHLAGFFAGLAVGLGLILLLAPKLL
jgi:hypothetical protein